MRNNESHEVEFLKSFLLKRNIFAIIIKYYWLHQKKIITWRLDNVK